MSRVKTAATSEEATEKLELMTVGLVDVVVMIDDGTKNALA